MREIEYLGADTCVLLAVDAFDAPVTVRLRNAEAGRVSLCEGDAVKVSLPPDDLWVLES